MHTMYLGTRASTGTPRLHSTWTATDNNSQLRQKEAGLDLAEAKGRGTGRGTGRATA